MSAAGVNRSGVAPQLSPSPQDDAAPIKIDPITSLQDDIDGLSLAMFEALRGLRDAVAPESGNLGGGTALDGTTASNSSSDNITTTTTEPDMDEAWQAYKAKDPATVRLVEKVVADGGALPQRREDFVRLHAKMEMTKDHELVMKLSATVLHKSQQINEHVDALPGVDRTAQQQRMRIQELCLTNQQVTAELEAAYVVAEQRRDACRTFVRTSTGDALGI